MQSKVYRHTHKLDNEFLSLLKRINELSHKYDNSSLNNLAP